MLNGEKGGIINNVYLRVAPDSYYEMHIDTDDANAHLINNGDIGIILK
jgi:propanediol utilization protein